MNNEHTFWYSHLMYDSKVTDLFHINPRYDRTSVSDHLKRAVDLLRSGVAMAMWFSRPNFHSIFGTPRSPCGEADGLH